MQTTSSWESEGNPGPGALPYHHGEVLGYTETMEEELKLDPDQEAVWS